MRYLSPTISSNSFIVFANASGVRRSYPAAKAWHVSIHTPTRALSSTPSMISLSSSNRPPMTFPAPAMFSSSGTTPSVSLCARFSIPAIRPHASRMSAPPVLPGWKLYMPMPSSSQRRKSSTKLS